MKKWMIRALSGLLIAAFLPLSVLADEYDLNEGSVTVSTTKGADGSTQQNVTHKDNTKPDSNPTITSKGQQTGNTVIINAGTGTTANVTIKDTNIGASFGTPAVKTEGKGDVNLNVEGNNTVHSSATNAGVEKANDGNLTIGSESGSGKLTANGGSFGAGIGGGSECNVSNITITGGKITAKGGYQAAGIGGGSQGSGSNIIISSGEVTANGGEEAAGIGGGREGAGSNIIITGGEVTANGGDFGAGIGGGRFNGSGSDITISGGEVTANGGKAGAGIGGGQGGYGSDITISKDSQVKATGGAGDGISDWGASIGCGGNYDGTPGAEVSPDTSGLSPTGKVERIRGDGTVLDTITGTVEPPVEPEKSASAEEEPDKREPLYRVLNLDGSSLKHQAQKADGVLALTAKADGAILTGTLRALGYLQNQGIEKITFTDGTHSAELVLAELIAKGQPEDVYVLTLGAENTLTLNGEAIDF